MALEFYSNGKLLLSGEYAVLDGAMAWAIPTKFGQYLRVASNGSSQISWKSFDEKAKVWFEGTYAQDTINEISTSDEKTSKALQKILSEARQLNPNFLSNSKGYEIETELTFPKDWGLGSSSTLINNVANWAEVNAQELLLRTFGGSGYDIACAQHDSPILFQIKNELPVVQEIHRNPPFADFLYFIYLNHKKNSRDAISAYKARTIDKTVLTAKISKITQEMIACTDLADFKHLIRQHEEVLSKVLGIPTVKSELFSDFLGTIKSLGGWGGDFILATGDKNTPEYFKNKGYHTVIPFNDMIL